MSLVLACFAGCVFGVGLLLAGMTKPARVVGFLDVTGSWDPSLAFVMGGAVAAIFGVGWGLGGLCPGPAIVAAFAGNSAALVFVATMLIGMVLARSLKR